MVPPASLRVSRVRRYSGYWLPTLHFVYGAFTLFGLPSQVILLWIIDALFSPQPRMYCYFRFALIGSLSLATTQEISFDFSSSPYLDVSVQAVFLRIPMYSVYDDRRWIRPGSPIQKSTGRRLFAPIRGLSQLITSFFGSWCQGILHVLFLTWPLCFKSLFSTWASTELYE